MPVTNTYRIIIENSTAEDTSPIAGQSSSPKPQKKKSTNSPYIAPSVPSVSFSEIYELIAYKKIKPYVSQLITSEVQKAGLRTGSNRIQEKASFYYSISSSSINFIESVFIGGKIGGVYGAIGGAVLSVAHTGLSFVASYTTLKIKQNIEEETIRNNLIRAGAKGSRSNE